MSRIWPSLLGAAALAMPAAPAAASGISVSLCGLPGTIITIPIDRAPRPEDHDCCRDRACHAGCERKRRTAADAAL